MLGYLSAPEVASGYFVANFGTWERKQKSPLALFYVPQHQHAVRRHIKKEASLMATSSKKLLSNCLMKL